MGPDSGRGGGWLDSHPRCSHGGSGTGKKVADLSSFFVFLGNNDPPQMATIRGYLNIAETRVWRRDSG